MQHVEDVSGAEACGELNNVVLLGARFVDGTGLGSNKKQSLCNSGEQVFVIISSLKFLK